MPVTLLQTQRDVSVVLDVPHPAPVVGGNVELLRLALRNVVENALAVSPPGHTVLAQVADKNGAVCIAVTDDGPGMSQEDLCNATARFGPLGPWVAANQFLTVLSPSTHYTLNETAFLSGLQDIVYFT